MRKQPVPEKKSPTPGLSRGDKTRLILMSVALVFVTVAFFGAVYQKNRLARADESALPSDDAARPTERVRLPDIDRARFESLVDDAEPDARVEFPRDAVVEMIDVARRLSEPHFEALGVRDLDASLAKAILDDPPAYRAQAFRARGWIDWLRTRNLGDGTPEIHQGRLVLEDFTPIYFVVLEQPERATMGSFVRVDGLFLNAFKRRGDEGWVEGPMLVGPAMVRSEPAFGPVTQLDSLAFAGVTDDHVTQGITGLPFSERWRLLAYARDVDSDAIDWEAAPELDNRTIQNVLEDGAGHRLQPFRVPPSHLMDIRVIKAGENPARMEEITDGWIGNTMWTGEAKVLRFQMPGALRGLDRRDLVTARGFFLKNWAYEPAPGGMRVAPVFVLQSLEKFVPPVDPTVDYVTWAVVVMSITLIVGIAWLVARGRRESESLRRELTRRRRARAQARTEASPG